MATLLSRLRPCISVRLITSRVFSSPSFRPHNSLSSSSFSRPFLNPRAFVGYPIKDADAGGGGVSRVPIKDADAGGGGVSRAPIKDADAGGGGVSRAPIKDADAAGGGVSRAPMKDASARSVFMWAREFYTPRKTRASRELSVSDDTADDTKTELYQVYMGERQPDDYDTSEIASHIDLLAPLLGSKEAARESLKYSYHCKISGFGAMLTALQAKRLAEFPNVVSVLPCRCFIPDCSAEHWQRRN